MVEATTASARLSYCSASVHYPLYPNPSPSIAQVCIIYPLHPNPPQHTHTHTHTTAFHWQRQKVLQVQQALNSDPVDIEALRKHAVSHGGLMRAHVRKKAWPKLVGVNVYDIEPYKGPPLSIHKDRAQVLL